MGPAENTLRILGWVKFSFSDFLIMFVEKFGSD